MLVLVTGSAGHLGDALIRRLPDDGFGVRGFDRVAGPGVDVVGSVEDRSAVRAAMAGVDAVIHAATLHKPHVATHTRAEFVATNVAGTLNVLEEAAAAGVGSFVFTSTTSAFGRALADGDDEAAWIDERVVPRPKNIYGVTKCAAEDLCELVHRDTGLPVVVLRTSRFFPEADDVPERAAEFDDLNLKVIELLHRRIDLDDVVSAHAAALRRAPAIGFAKYVVSATPPFARDDAVALRRDAATLIQRVSDARTAEVFADRDWRLPPSLDRVYDNSAARRDLEWEPHFTFDHAIERLHRGEHPFSDLTVAVGSRGYHRPA